MDTEENAPAAKRPKSEPQKPSKGTLGTQMELLSSFFRIRFEQSKFYTYVPYFEPPLDNMCQRGVKRYLLSTQNATLGPWLLTGENIFTMKDLGEEYTFEAETTKGDPMKYKVTLKGAGDPSSRTLLHVYNSLFKRILKLRKYKQLGRNSFDSTKREDFPEFNFEVWQGFSTSLSLNEGGFMLNTGLAFKVLRKDNCWDIMQEARSQQEKADLFQNCSVVSNDRTYLVSSVRFDMSPMDTFPRRKNGEVRNVSFMDYYSDIKNPIHTVNQPLFEVKQRRGDTIYLVPELCRMTGISDRMRQDFSLMKKMASVTRVEPEERARRLEGLIRGIAESQEPKIKEIMDQWRLQIDRQMHRIPGRVLSVAPICFQHDKQVRNNGGDWTQFWKEGVKFLTPMSLGEWVVVYLSRDTKAAEDFIRTFASVASPFGMQVPNPQRVALRSDDPESYCREILSHEKASMVVCILPTPRADRYSAIKTAAAQCGRLTQCIKTNNVADMKKLKPVCTKIAQQINSKMGGSLWRTAIGLTERTMVCGIDICHDRKSGGRSVLGFAASINSDFTQYTTVTMLAPEGAEIQASLRTCLRACLSKFCEIHSGAIPSNVIIFRGGVGGGQIAAVRDSEIPQLRGALEGLRTQPKLALVLVTKKINARFFNGQGRNPPAGCVIDSQVVTKTEEKESEFYLISQHCPQGTVSPTQYQVLLNETPLVPDDIQMLTFRLCHLYYNWPGAISVPACMQYAHKAAFLVSQATHQPANEKLANYLHYL